MEIFDYRDVEAIEAGEGRGIRVRWLITKEMGAENFAMRLFEIEPGGYSPLHSHPWEHEVFILEGKGIVKSGGRKYPFKEGDVIFIPLEETHQFKNDGDKMVKFLCLIPYQKG
jgi:quercetin dioxygenase-like cupin family protein